MSQIVFRADGDSNIGLGHVMRCLALVNMLKDDFEKTVFAIAQPSPHIAAEIEAAGADIWTVCNERSDFISKLDRQDIVVVDSYTFNDACREEVMRRGSKMVYIDDLHEGFITADVIINHAIGASASNYHTPPYTKLCLGAKYAMLRAPFGVPGRMRKVSELASAFICFGGADPENITLKVLQAAINAPAILKIHIVVGSAYIHISELKKYIQQQTVKNISLHQNLNATEMASLMQDCDMAIAPSSTIAYELGSTGIGFITGIQADNQQYIHQSLVANNIAITVGDFRKVNTSDITAAIGSLNTNIVSQQIASQLATFGNSKDNFRRVFQKLALEQQCSIRRATSADMEQYFVWVNDKEVRKHSVNSAPVPLENHASWFNSKVKSPSHFFYVLEYMGQPAGQLRFDKQDNTYTINYSLDRNFRGKGLGEAIVRLSVAQLSKDIEAYPALYAIVKKDNPASQKAFKNNNFNRQSDTVINGIAYEVYTR